MHQLLWPADKVSFLTHWVCERNKQACWLVCRCVFVFLSFACTPVSLCAWLYSCLISGFFELFLSRRPQVVWRNLLISIKPNHLLYRRHIHNFIYKRLLMTVYHFYLLFGWFPAVENAQTPLWCDTQRGVGKEGLATFKAVTNSSCLFLMDCIIYQCFFSNLNIELLIQYLSLSICLGWHSLTVWHFEVR